MTSRELAIKHTTEGYLVYAAMAGYLAAAACYLARRRRIADIVAGIGFSFAFAAFALRWSKVGHIPFKDLFEVFLAMGMMVYPLCLFCRVRLRVGAEAWDMAVGALVLFPAGFVFDARPRNLPPPLQCWLFAPHVGVYLLAYVAMAKATGQAMLQWFARPPEPPLCEPELGTYRIVSLGFPMLTLGLILGSWWGKLAWGDYWGWDPKEMLSLASWLAFAIYLHFRHMFGRRYPAWNSFWVVLGMVLILVTLLWANLSRLFPGLHNYAT